MAIDINFERMPLFLKNASEKKVGECEIPSESSTAIKNSYENVKKKYNTLQQQLQDYTSNWHYVQVNMHFNLDHIHYPYFK